MRRVAFIISALLLGCVGVLPAYAAADTTTRTCKDGSTSHSATQAEADSANSGGIIVGQTQLCPEDAKLGISAEVGQAKEFLRSRYQPGKCSATTGADGINRLDDQFAINLANMLKKAPMTLNINSAYRSPSAQQCANPSAPNSNHIKGCAVDLQYNQNNCDSAACQWVLKNAAADKLQVRMQRAPEWNHIEPVSCKGSSLGGAGTGFNITPQQINATGNLMQGLGNIFAPPQPQQCPPGYILLNGSCLPQQALAQTQTTNPLSYASPPPVTPGAINPSSSGTGSTNTNTNVNGNGSTNIGTSISGLIDSNGNTKTGTSTSAIDLINAIANPTTTTAYPATTATGSPVTLGSNLGNTVALHGTNVSLNGATQGSSTYALSPGGTQTFVSDDLSKTPTSLSSMPPVTSTFAVLENIKQVLLAVLQYLKPFGGVTPHAATVNNSATAYME